MTRIRVTLVCLLLLLPTVRMRSQDDCPQLKVPQVIPGSNMFNAQQEVWLGEAQAAEREQAIIMLQNKALIDHLQNTVDQLALNLPPDHIPFRVRLIDVANADAFSSAGGRIYVSRKIVAFTRSQDELAGLLAHEMGHITAHHAAIETSEQFRKVLGVNQVTDRDDVFAKWNQLVSNYRKQKSAGHDKAFEVEEREQVQADTIALYLVARAGYSPQAFETFFDRLAGTKGDTGGFWSNLFGTTKPDAKRLGQIIKNTPAMPKSCTASDTALAANYDTWKKSVVETSAADFSHQESLPGLVSKRVLTERLRPEIQHIRISPDGKFALAQDDSNVFVIQREPLQSVFRFDAPDADSAEFTPDSHSVVLLFEGVGSSPRVERWDISSQKLAEAHEIYVRDGCLLSRVSPDGRTLSCLTLANESNLLKIDLDLYDVASGSSFLHKKGWMTLFAPGTLPFLDLQLLVQLEIGSQRMLESMSPMAFSLDSHYFVAHSHQNTLAVDLISHNPIDIPGGVKNLLDYSFVFLPNGNLVGVAGNNGEKSAEVTFPAGNVVYKDLNIGGSHLHAVAHGDYVILRPIKDHPLGIFDLKQNKIILASKRSALDVYGDKYMAERLDGDLLVFDLATVKPLDHLQLGDAPLGKVWANAISPDLNWLAISQKTRGAVWNLQTGQRLYHVRGFMAAYFGPDGGLYADFPKYLSTERMIARASLSSDDVRPQRTVDEKKHTIEVGRYLLTIAPAKDSNPKNDVTFELWDVIDQKVSWTKHFPHERPEYHVDVRGNSLAFYWKTNTQSAKSIAKDDSKAAAVIAGFKDKDSAVFVQVFELDTGQLRGEMAFDTGKHSIQVMAVLATADRVIVADGEKRVLVYSFDGQQLVTIAGHSPEVSTQADLLTVKTAGGELELYDLSQMQLRKRTTYDFKGRVAFDGFSADGKRLLVLTADQTVYLLDPAAATTDTAEALASKEPN